MTKAEIVEQIYERVGFSKKEAAELVDRGARHATDSGRGDEQCKEDYGGTKRVRHQSVRPIRVAQTLSKSVTRLGSSGYGEMYLLLALRLLLLGLVVRRGLFGRGVFTLGLGCRGVGVGLCGLIGLIG